MVLGYLFETQITLASDSKCTVKVLEALRKAAKNFSFASGCSSTKMNDPLNGFSKKQLKLGFRNYSNTM
jgi:16S rRNA (uracil1498-N3)-methyltransferase